MLYTIGFLIFSVFYLPTLLLKGKLHRDFAERFARYDGQKARALLSGRDRIWIQAVSVGEVGLCREFVPLLRSRFPDHDIVISTITKTGNDLAKRIFSADATVIYFPLDLGPIVKKAVEMIKPCLYVMVETEIWPNLLKELRARSVPSVLINGRISDRSIGKYMLVRPFLKEALASIKVFCMQDTIDAERIVKMGAPPDRVKVTGNMKFDVSVPEMAEDSRKIRASLGLADGEELIVAGSTHGGEEEMIVGAFKEVSREYTGLRLLIAPRHIERAGEVESAVKKAGFKPVRVSEMDGRRTADGERRILILDTIGRLNEAYSAAALVFIGGSFVKHGGQNPIEPAALAKPILFGPHMFNFKYAANALLDNGGALQVSGMDDLAAKFKLLMKDGAQRNRLGENAKMTVLKNKGAAKKNIEEISGVLA